MDKQQHYNTERLASYIGLQPTWCPDKMSVLKITSNYPTCACKITDIIIEALLPVSLSSKNTTEDLKWTSSEASGRVCSKCSELWQASGGHGQGWRTFWTFHTTAICLLLSDLTLASKQLFNRWSLSVHVFLYKHLLMPWCQKFS